MTNIQKYILVLAAGGVVALGPLFAEPMFPGWWPLVAHFGGGVVSALIGLQVTLSKSGTPPAAPGTK